MRALRRELRRYFWGVVGAIALAAIGMMLTGGNKSLIQINFALWPEELEGAEVWIDGELAGELETMGRRHMTGFRVDDGQHIVEIVHPDLPCKPVRVTTGYGATQVLLMADYTSMVNAEGESIAGIHLEL